ncbi:hypothetical protein OPKNFCMD_5888 [Methylobacterium crusticola]|uniref:Uncharacterized protein n=1 Tax=Methylobacterium crusticola TaxID=1697972 RepID=A0ABQ4R6R9_9HYPH|nr:hypothetical protein OPKNFCMD_5888 [Methylobacterium crusticola]
MAAGREARRPRRRELPDPSAYRAAAAGRIMV